MDLKAKKKIIVFLIVFFCILYCINPKKKKNFILSLNKYIFIKIIQYENLIS